MMMKKDAALCAPLLLVLAAQPAHGQIASGGQPASIASASSGAADTARTIEPANRTGPDNSVGEIVVTAQRRSENLQNVPVAVAALSGSQLATRGVVNMTDLGHVVPTLAISNNVGFTITSLRGIGSAAIGPGVENPISIYVDGVYYASTTSSLFSLSSIDRLEVLKGPQGTLFGRNATAGLIQVFTRDPSKGFTANAHASYGNYETARGDFYVGGPINSWLAADISVQAEGMGKGFGKNLYNGDDVDKTDASVSVRSKWVATLAPETRVTLIGDYSYQKNSHNGERTPPGSVSPLGIDVSGGSPWDENVDKTPRFINRNYGVSLKIDQDLGFGQLSNIVAYRHSYADILLDVDYTPAPFENVDLIDRERQFSEEFRIASQEGSHIKWQTGLFYFNADGKYDPAQIEFAAAPTNPAFDPVYPIQYLNVYGDQHTTSVAGYGQASVELIHATNLTVGARYTHEERNIVGRTDAILVSGSSIGTIDVNPKQSISFNKPTFRASLDHRFSPNVLAYVSFNTGFKSGGFNTQNPGDPAYRPESLKAYEAGVKTDLLDRRVRFNLDGFYYDYTDIQVQKALITGIGIINGASAHVWGIESDVDAVVTPRLRLNASAAYTHARFVNFQGAPISTPSAGVPVVTGDASGNDLPKAPHFQGVINADYRLDLGASRVNIDATYTYNSGYFIESDNMFRQNAFHLLNASATWTAPNGRYSVKLWGNNLTNKAVIVAGATTSLGTRSAHYDSPRTYGVTLGYNFK
jgi:iron complex outermembrane recepter protein